MCTYYIPSSAENTKRKLHQEVQISLASSPAHLLRAGRWRGATQTLQMWLTILHICGHTTWAFKHLCSCRLSLLMHQPSMKGEGGVEAAHGTALSPAALHSSGTTFWSCPALTMPSREMMLRLVLCSQGCRCGMTGLWHRGLSTLGGTCISTHARKQLNKLLQWEDTPVLNISKMQAQVQF